MAQQAAQRALLKMTLLNEGWQPFPFAVLRCSQPVKRLQLQATAHSQVRLQDFKDRTKKAPVHCHREDKW